MYFSSKFIAGVVSSIGVVALSTGLIGQQSRKTTDAPMQPHGKLGQDLFIAIGQRDIAKVQDLLAHGADPDSRNGLEFSPLFLAAATHQQDALELLIKSGAKPAYKSNYGTALTFACMTGNLEGAKTLIGKGLKIDDQRNDGMTPLMMAANCGATPVVAELLADGAKPNIKDDSGATALSLAARHGSVEAGELLIKAGANVDNADLDGCTPLMEASQAGYANFVTLLLKYGAKPNLKDSVGRTSMMLATSYGNYPEVVRALKSGGASTSIKDKQGRTAIQIASLHGYADSANALGSNSVHPRILPVKESIKRGLVKVIASMRAFNEATTCISCHHEGLGRMTTGAAKGFGFTTDPGVEQVHINKTNGMIGALESLHKGAVANPELMKQLPLAEINEVTTVDGWILAGMADCQQKASPAIGPMTTCLARQQMPDGSYTFALPRVPMQSSFFTFTALTCKAIANYGDKAMSKENREHLEKARQWLVSANPQNAEDRASRLLGLKWSGGTAEQIAKATADVLADQQKDGGWATVPGSASDAYATGMSLYALHTTGTSTKTKSYTDGVRYLLRTQDDDGTWFVAKRAMPANNYLDTGFPHGESQYASFNGTCWALLGLMQTLN